MSGLHDKATCHSFGALTSKCGRTLILDLKHEAKCPDREPSYLFHRELETVGNEKQYLAWIEQKELLWKLQWLRYVFLMGITQSKHS